MDDATKERIENDIKNNKVMLYMKGEPTAPACGFSSQVVNILDYYKVPYNSFNILIDDEIRQGIKDYSDWPTIPQLYVNGEFVGGCDILTEMHNNGELKQLLEAV